MNISICCVYLNHMVCKKKHRHYMFRARKVVRAFKGFTLCGFRAGVVSISLWVDIFEQFVTLWRTTLQFIKFYDQVAYET